MINLTNSSTRLYAFAATLLGFWIFISAEDIDSRTNQSGTASQNEEQYYEWSIWSPCTRTCGIGIQFRGQRCLRKEKNLCRPLPREHQTCNTQACPPGGTDFRDLQCGIYNGRDIFINGERAKWMSYIRGNNRCLLFCYPYGEQLYYYFGRVRDGTQCSKEPYGVCIFGRCKPVGCDNVLQSGVYRDKCRLCGGNSTTCEPVRGTVQRAPTRFERLSGYAEIVTIPRGSTTVTLMDNTWNYLALRRQNGEFAINGNRIVNWPSMFKVGDMEVEYKRLSDNINETLKILGPTTEDLIVKSLLVTKEVNVTFEYWRPIRADKVALDNPLVKLPLVWQRPYVGWGKWTACSASCGGGIRVRARHCSTYSTSSCANGETEVEGCNEQPCDEIKAEWSEWGSWNGCSASCGGGARVRFRYCKRPSYSVKTGCSNKRFEVELCNIDKCPEKNSTSVKAKTTKSLQGSSSLSSSLMTTEVKAQRTSTILTISRIPAMELSSSKVEAQRLQSLAFELTPGEGILNIQAKDYMGSEKVLLAISTGERPKISLTETSTLANQAVYSLASSYRTLSLTHHSLTRALNTYVESPVTLTISPATTSLDSGFAIKDAVVGALLDGEQENVSSFHGKLTSSYYDKRSTVDTSSLQSKPSLKDSINSEPVLMLRSRSFDGGQPLQPATLPSPTLAISPKVQMETPTLNHTLARSTSRMVTGKSTQSAKESQTRRKMVTSSPGLQTSGSFSVKRPPHLVTSFDIGKASILGAKSFVSSVDATHGPSIEHESNFKTDASVAYRQVTRSWQRRNVDVGSASFAGSSNLAILQLTPVAFLMQRQSKEAATTALQSLPFDNASNSTILSRYHSSTALYLSMDTSETLKRKSETRPVESRMTQESVLVESSHLPKAAPYSSRTPSSEQSLQYLLLMTVLPSSTTVTSTLGSQHETQPSLKTGPQRESSSIDESHFFTFHRSSVYFTNVSVSTDSKRHDTSKVESLSRSSSVQLKHLSSSSPSHSLSGKVSSIGSQSMFIYPSMPFSYIESSFSSSIIHSSPASAVANKESILDTTTEVNLSKISSSNPHYLSPSLTTLFNASGSVGTKSTHYSTSKIDTSKLLSSNQLKYSSFSTSSGDAVVVTSSLMTSSLHFFTTADFFSTTIMQDEETTLRSSMTTASIVDLAARTTVVKLTLASRSVEGQNLTSVTGVSNRTVNELAASTSALSIMGSHSSILPNVLQCPPCDLSDRLREKFCHSDYAVLVRVRSQSFSNGSLTSYTVKVKKVFKTIKIMKKKPELRIVGGKCHCNVELLLKKDYIIMGSDLDKMKTIEVLTLSRESFLAQWEIRVEEDVERADDYCSSNFTINPMAVTSAASREDSVASMKSSMIRGTILSTPFTITASQRASMTSSDAIKASVSLTISTGSVTVPTTVEDNCGPCKMEARRNKAYCMSDFVIRVKIILEAINEFSLDMNYRIALIYVFKTSTNRTALTKVWILNNVCRCPELVPNKEYLLMGSMADRAGSSDKIALISRQSYVQEWKDSMFRRLAEFANSCEPKTTSGFSLGSTNEITSTALPNTAVKSGTVEVTSQPKTSSTAAKPTVQCRRCRISKKQKKNYCNSDYAIHAKILQSSFNGTTQERKYTVQIRHVLGTKVPLTDREELWVIDDYCQCPVLTLEEEYLIMGTVKAFSTSGARLIIPSRPYVAKWKSRMRTRLISGICDS